MLWINSVYIRRVYRGGLFASSKSVTKQPFEFGIVSHNTKGSIVFVNNFPFCEPPGPVEQIIDSSLFCLIADWLAVLVNRIANSINLVD